MPNKSILILRVVVTLACLVGVPAVALMGIRNPAPTGSRRTSVDAEGSAAQRATGRPAATQRAGPTDFAPRNPAPSATIRDIAVDTAPRLPSTDVHAVTYVAPETAGGDRLAIQLQRLQQLGATYYRLESSPSAAAEFRFHCRISGIEQPFEATSPTAAAAVGQVLHAVEQARRAGAAKNDQPVSVYAR
ncbi:MAG: hypothetical protein WD875_03020 [Pirellulales bacterium]